MNRFLLILILGITLFSCVRTKTENKAVENFTAEGKNIDNSKTDKHINIPGTRLFIVPPADFKIATSFVGLQKDDKALLQIQDLVDVNYYTYAPNFSKEEFERKDVKIFEYKEFKMNDFSCVYIFLQNNKNKNEYEVGLFFGDSTFFTQIYADYPSSDNKTGEEIQKSMKTIYYDKNFKVDDPLATAPFTLDESKSVFKFSKVKSGMFMYYVDGKDIKNNDEPFIIVSALPGIDKPPKNVSEDLLSSLEEDMLTDEELKNISTANVNGLPAYEVEIYGKIERKKILIYQLIVYGTNQTVVIQGFVKSDFDNNLREIKNLARTIKLNKFLPLPPPEGES